MPEPIHVRGPRGTANINQSKRVKDFGRLKKVLIHKKVKNLKKKQYDREA